MDRAATWVSNIEASENAKDTRERKNGGDGRLAVAGFEPGEERFRETAPGGELLQTPAPALAQFPQRGSPNEAS